MLGNICRLVLHMPWTVVVLHNVVYWLVTQSCSTLCNPMDCSLARFLCPWDFLGKNTKSGLPFPSPSALYVLNYLVHTKKSSWKRYNFTPHFVTTGTEAWKDYKLLPWSHTALNRRQKFELGQLKVKAYVFTYFTPLFCQLYVQPFGSVVGLQLLNNCLG